MNERIVRQTSVIVGKVDMTIAAHQAMWAHLGLPSNAMLTERVADGGRVVYLFNMQNYTSKKRKED